MAGCACVLELLAEPLYILSQNLLLLKLRLVVETAATLARCLTMYILIVNQIYTVRLKSDHAVNLDIYMLWICLVRPPDPDIFFFPFICLDLMISLGSWAIPLMFASFIGYWSYHAYMVQIYWFLFFIFCVKLSDAWVKAK